MRKSKKAVRQMNFDILKRMHDDPAFSGVMAATNSLEKILAVYATVFEIELPWYISLLDPETILDTQHALTQAKKRGSNRRWWRFSGPLGSACLGCLLRLAHVLVRPARRSGNLRGQAPGKSCARRQIEHWGK